MTTAMKSPRSKFQELKAQLADRKACTNVATREILVTEYLKSEMLREKLAKDNDEALSSICQSTQGDVEESLSCIFQPPASLDTNEEQSQKSTHSKDSMDTISWHKRLLPFSSNRFTEKSSHDRYKENFQAAIQDLTMRFDVDQQQRHICHHQRRFSADHISAFIRRPATRRNSNSRSSVTHHGRLLSSSRNSCRSFLDDNSPTYDSDGEESFAIDNDGLLEPFPETPRCSTDSESWDKIDNNSLLEPFPETPRCSKDSESWDKIDNNSLLEPFPETPRCSTDSEFWGKIVGK
jgi:hypothetical protein